jgi:hypothetical protein
MAKNVIRIESQEDTPLVCLDNDDQSASLSISGVSMPENTLEFYEPLFKQLEISLDPSVPLKLSVHFDYMNSMSNKQIVKLIDLLRRKMKALTVQWKYSDGDELMAMKGKELQNLFKGTDFTVSAQ